MATCKDCLHYDACKKFNKIRTNVINDSDRGAENLCEVYADKARFIELPCRVGDTVYYLGGFRKKYIKTAIVEEIIIDHGGIRDLVVTVDCGTFEMPFSTFFVNREEAEAALAERIGEEK